jgi:Flp pilus assembly pilin Flp
VLNSTSVNATRQEEQLMGAGFRLLRGDDGQDLVEYALLAGLISVTCMLGLEALVGGIETLVSIISAALRNA